VSGRHGTPMYQLYTVTCHTHDDTLLVASIYTPPFVHGETLRAWKKKQRKTKGAVPAEEKMA